MHNRVNLRSQTTRAWLETVNCDYKRQRVNSEASLQAAYWSHLNAILLAELPDTRRLFVEPSMRIRIKNSDGTTKPERRYPDIVVCDTKEVIGIIELKYRPKVEPNFNKDLLTFAWVAEHRNEIYVSNTRYRGDPVDPVEYKISKNLLYVWAGIHSKAKAHSAMPHINPELKRYFHELHEVTTQSPI